MSTQLARAPRVAAGTAPTSTRQQLDELDALLQRMLELPVQPGEDEPDAEPRRPEPAREASRPTAARMEMLPGEPQPAIAVPRRTAQPEPAAPARTGGKRSYPASYMVVESNTPEYLNEPPASDRAPNSARLGPRLVSAEDSRAGNSGIDMPVPGGSHDLEADEPVDPAGDLARLQAELGAGPEEWVPFHSSWQPSEQTWKPLAETWQQAKSGSSTMPPVPAESPKLHPAELPPSDTRPRLRDLPRATVMPPPPPVAAVAAPPPAAAPRTAPKPTVPRTSPAALPLVWFNAAFDLLLVPLGPAGEWLQGKGGGGFLALLGLLCLAGATGLAVADWFSWTW